MTSPVFTVPPDFLSAVSAGLVPGAQVLFVIGHASNVAQASAPIDICEQGTIYPFLAAAATLKVSSTSANDTAAGTGARTVLIQGLDTNYNVQTETVTLNGTSAVNTVNQYIRINGFAVTSAGSIGTNAGDITLQLSTGGSIQGIIRAGIGDSQQAVLTVPAGYIGILVAAQYSIAGPAATSFGQAALTANVFGPTARAIGIRSDLNSGFPYNEAVLTNYPNPPKTDITARLLSCGQDATEISGGFTLLLLKQSAFGLNPNAQMLTV